VSAPRSLGRAAPRILYDLKRSGQSARYQAWRRGRSCLGPRFAKAHSLHYDARRAAKL